MDTLTVTYKGLKKEFTKPCTYYDISKEFNVSHAIVAYVKKDLIPLDEQVRELDENKLVLAK